MDNIVSQSIKNIRFPLCAAIVMIHSNITIYNTSAAQNTIVNLFSDFFIINVCYSAVALFFFISGYLFFHEGLFNIHIFKHKLYNRIYSLLIPYILWNAICLSIIFILQFIIPNFNLLVHKQISEFSISDFIMTFWNLQDVSGVNSDQMGPLVGQFWFLQCLLIFSLLTPIIWFCTKKCGILFVVLLAIVSQTVHIPNLPGFNIVSLYYFSLGAYFSITKHNWYVGKKYVCVLLIIYIVLYITQQNTHWNCLTIFGDTLLVFSILNMATFYTKDRKSSSIIIYLSNASFFIFAIHRYFTSLGLNIASHLTFSNCITPILCCFIITFISLLGSIMVYKLMDKFSHKILLVLNGKRINITA